jgi:hypothetical protein
MAIDPFLFDTYKQYKAGTDKVTTWLANKEREMNTFDGLFPSEATSAKGKGRLKGKARQPKWPRGRVEHMESPWQLSLELLRRFQPALQYKRYPEQSFEHLRR